MSVYTRYHKQTNEEIKPEHTYSKSEAEQYVYGTCLAHFSHWHYSRLQSFGLQNIALTPAPTLWDKENGIHIGMNQIETQTLCILKKNIATLNMWLLSFIQNHQQQAQM